MLLCTWVDLRLVCSDGGEGTRRDACFPCRPSPYGPRLDRLVREREDEELDLIGVTLQGRIQTSVPGEGEVIMGIAQKVARNFSEAVRSRGQSYFSKGRVTMMSAKPNEVVAKVRGTTKYRVRVRLRGAKLLASCTCPYFSPQGEPCKHLWATLLLADSRGILADGTELRGSPDPGAATPDLLDRRAARWWCRCG